MTPTGSSEDIAGQSGVPVAVTTYRVSLNTKRDFHSDYYGSRLTPHLFLA